MLTVAIQQALKPTLGRVYVIELPDYVKGAGAVHAVYVAPGGDEIIYDARVQIRTRGDDVLSAEAAAFDAREAMLDLRYQTVEFDDPRDAPGVTRTYHFLYIDPVERPTYIPSPTAGYLFSANYRLFLREV
jgi:hypothetical protein